MNASELGRIIERISAQRWTGKVVVELDVKDGRVLSWATKEGDRRTKRKRV